MSKKMLFIYNPHSGKAKLKLELSDVLSLFVRNGWDVNVHPTQYQTDATALVRKRASEFDLVVCSGGDGTIDEVVEGMLESHQNVPIGYIPTGTVNDFATSLGIPKDIMGAAASIIDAEPFACDICKFNKRHFNYVAAFGIFTKVSYATPQDLKNVLGKTAYVLEGVLDIVNLNTHHMKIEVDGKQVEGDFIYGSVSNSHSVAGLPVAYSPVNMSDGIIEGLFIRKPEPFGLIPVLDTLINGNPDPGTVEILRGKDWKIHSDQSIDWTLDGEYGGTVQDIVIGVEHKAVSIMVPKKDII